MPMNAVAVASNKIFAIGGSGLGGMCLSEMEVFDPETGEWRMEPSMISARAGLGAGSFGGNIFVFGGINDNGQLLSTVEVRLVMPLPLPPFFFYNI
jgi:hypothetical protein